MEDVDAIRQHFEGPFGVPATAEQLKDAEARLGHELPPLLKLHYAAYDGFKGPTTTDFFYSLEQLATTTLWLRREGYFPKFIQHSVALGDDGVGNYWLIDIEQPDVVIDWNAEMEREDRVLLAASLSQAWIERSRDYVDTDG